MAIPLKVNIRGLFVRRTATGLTVAGVGLIVMVFVLVWGMAAGLTKVFTFGVDDANLLVMRDGSNAESTSWIPRDKLPIIAAHEGIDKGADGNPLCSGELIILINQERRGGNGETSNITVRGVTAAGPALRPELKVVEGRLFQPGMNELIASRGMAARFKGCALGETLEMRKTDYKVVGIFEAAGSPYESELWTDANDLGTTHGRPGYSSAMLKVSDPVARARISAAVDTDQQMSVMVTDQKSYFDKQTQSAGLIQGLGTMMTIFLSIGACFSAANTMYASVINRSREIGTLRAIGFTRGSILVAYVVEAVILSSLAGAFGVVLGGLILEVYSGHLGTSNWVTFSEVVFQLALTPGIVVAAMITSAVIGTIGGFLPALRAARMPIVEAIRAV